MNIEEAITEFISIEGAVAAMLVDSSSGMILADKALKNFDTETAAAGNTSVVQSKRKIMKMLNLDDHIQDILITLGKQIHLIVLLPSNDQVFAYVVVEKDGASLGLVRMKMNAVMKELRI